MSWYKPDGCQNQDIQHRPKPNLTQSSSETNTKLFSFRVRVNTLLNLDQANVNGPLSNDRPYGKFVLSENQYWIKRYHE